MQHWDQFVVYISKNKEWLFSGAGLMAIGFIVKFFIKPKPTNTNTNNTIEAGRDINGDITINNGFTEKQLKEFLLTIQEQLSNGLKHSLSEQEKNRLEKELQATEEKLQNITATYQQEVQLRKEAEKTILTLKSNQPKAKIARALEELRNNPDTRTVEKILDEIVESGTKELAPAAYESGKLAENRVDYRKAMKAFTKAVILDGNNPDYLLKAAQMARKVGNLDQAQQWFETLIKLTQHDTNSLDYAVAQSGLAGVFYEQGKYAKAEPVYKRSLAITEKALGENHPSVAATLNNLAELYRIQGKYAKAEPLYKRSLAITEKALGENHPSVAATLNNLAGLYKEQGEYAKAEPLYKESLAIKEKALGENHLSVAATLNNLAELYRIQGKYAKAEPLYKRSLAITEKALGENHPSVAATLNNLASLYEAQGEYAKAEPLYKRSLAITEKALGENHPSVAATLNNLASLYEAQGEYAKAEPLYKKALNILHKIFPKGHPYIDIVESNYNALKNKK
ncbi:tetratricopeptide repeat protein [Phocoenobacter skyensis]|uniref:Tetratricopeptide repeat protein n=1 Tax=Phocoenobacter skyensis TaxID=97481 RepID=A0A1H7VZI9_9PAST|nr:tetratricopeptide repeat protein [Pasteurella skyensis]MDP8079059.1 tetratricopeptide repeat protein [Pasteurella skyensis]MDP8085009.1 tetratricopeptide repeat protein [Pasteurella skyensis]MDP8184930.1 tetratricopeptide repeat protein [Pasteurella skyensis]QLB21762.1 hypothetical protein A6B44_00440 [Pasteurella skyensis]SEM14197.1 Tetratricopeptide repeat-containing protein [Pasteurella skyensis]